MVHVLLSLGEFCSVRANIEKKIEHISVRHVRISFLFCLMSLAHYYDVGRELHDLHELKHRGEFLPTRNGIMDKFGASV